MPSVPFVEGRYAESHVAECRYAECRYAECRYAECHYPECYGAMAITLGPLRGLKKILYPKCLKISNYNFKNFPQIS
jgi:hypothetical protein